MQRIFIVLAFAALLACSKDQEKQSSAPAGADKASETLESKRSTGDTLVASEKNLTDFLPDSVDGYFPEGSPEISGQKEAGNSWTMVRQKYKNGDKIIAISLADYNGAYGLYAGATSVFSDINSKEEKAEVFTMDNGKIKGWKSYSMHEHEAYVLLGVNNRYLITLEGKNQSGTAFLESLVDKIKMEDLPGY